MVPGPWNIDKLTFGLGLSFIKGIYSGKVKQRSKESPSKYDGPHGLVFSELGSRHFELFKRSFDIGQYRIS